MLLRVGMGWFGWSRRKTLRKTIPDLELHYAGRLEMIDLMRGGLPPGYAGEGEEPTRTLTPITPELFDAHFH
jgi:hypothetical protein